MVTHSKVLKALHICQRDDPAEGSAVRVAFEYVKRLPNYEIDAHCLFLYGNPAYFGNQLGDRAHYLNITNSKEFFKFWRLIEFIHKFKPDVIHHHDGLLWSNLLTFFHKNILKITHAHLGATLNNTKNSLLNRAKLAALIQRMSTDILICITKDTQTSHVQQGNYHPDKTYVLYNGVDQNCFSPPTTTEKITNRQKFGLPEDVVVVGFVGRLHCGMKGTDDFLKIIGILPNNFWALIVGGGSDEDYLKQLAIKLQISERVIFTGIIQNPVDAYHTLNILCMTSHYEPFGLVIAEAMSCQLPVIGFTCIGGSIELLNSDTGVVISDRDIQAMAQAIIQSVNHPEIWEHKHKQAQLLINQNHDWGKNSLKLSDVYKKNFI
jgi:glycosyltransferase involved in cell wall biosynthesis